MYNSSWTNKTMYLIIEIPLIKTFNSNSQYAYIHKQNSYAKKNMMCNFSIWKYLFFDNKMAIFGNQLLWPVDVVNKVIDIGDEMLHFMTKSNYIVANSHESSAAH